MKSFKKYLIWFFVTLAVFMVSVLMHMPSWRSLYLASEWFWQTCWSVM